MRVVEPGRSIIGRYELHSALASGGMATVHLGRMRSETGLGRTVALKRMHPHFAADPTFVEMFYDEARLAMRLQHPNIVATFDVVRVDAELLLVMEYIHGESLAGLERALHRAGERIPSAIASSIVSGVLAGLHAAHEARSEDGAPLQIVHRDVSPQNIMVGIDGTARLLDFGIAKAAGRLHSTAQGQLKGKFAYMAPEQLTGEDADRRADVFAAAVVLWEALTGTRLFKGETPGALVNAVLSSPIPPPSSVAPELSLAIDNVVMQGLARQKRDRFATARDMAVALEAALPPATARAVGEWVEVHAASSLRKRASLVRGVENAEGPPGADELQAQVPTRMEAVSGHDEIPSRAFSNAGPAAADETKAVSGRGGRRAWLAGMAFVLLAATIGSVVTRKSGTAAAIGPAAPAASSSPPTVAASSSAPMAPPPQAAVSALAPAPSASAVAPPSSASSAPRRLRPAAVVKPDCSNPFVVDSRGIRVPRPECF
jgi:serine/threonine-protein kinase